MDSSKTANRKVWNRAGIGTIIILLSMVVMGVVPVGTQYPSIHFNSTNGVVFLGDSNAATILIFTNKINMAANFGVVSNKSFRIEAGSTSTNYGETVTSNLTARGDFSALPLYASFSSLTNNDYSVTNATYLMITNCGASSNIIFTGFAAGRPGQHLTVDNATATNMWFLDQNASSVASSRLDLLGFTTTNTVGQGIATFIYNPVSNNWRMITINK